MSPGILSGLLVAQSDRRLLELARTGHERAFEILVHRYRRQLLRYCRRMGLSDAPAEDVLQHALLQSWLALQRGTEVRELRPWLYRIVHNTAVNAMRSIREDQAPAEDGICSPAAQESELERRIAVREALRDVAALPPMQRDAILLSAVDGRSHEEVARALGITHGAVRGLLYRARVTLRDAAAALTPQPLIAWAAGLHRGAPAAEKLAELSTQGSGAGVGGVLLKGAAMAVTTAVLLAGGAVVPLHRHPAHGSGGLGVAPATADTGVPSVRTQGAADGPQSAAAGLPAVDGGSSGRGRADLRGGPASGARAMRSGLSPGGARHGETGSGGHGQRLSSDGGGSSPHADDRGSSVGSSRASHDGAGSGRSEPPVSGSDDSSASQTSTEPSHGSGSPGSESSQGSGSPRDSESPRPNESPPGSGSPGAPEVAPVEVARSGDRSGRDAVRARSPEAAPAIKPAD
jgi:RNA polymerase sigma factor (sigma-70 family)